MTAAAQQTTRTPPRVLVESFWLLHRAVYRLSGGRIGLQQPEAGGRFGMMQVSTRGRRSGRRRSTIVGYFEDGPRLITLAINGWGNADPAWWLNLQSDAQAVVTLSDGPRTMRARAATGSERDRLWARFRSYPGWGDDIDALAASRPTPTAVVVFDPLSTQQGDIAEGAAAPSRSTPATHLIQPDRRTLKIRHLWLIPGLAVALYANAIASRDGLGLLPLLVFGIVPHLTVLAGMGQPHAHGQLAPRAVPLFNVMHHPVTPLIILALAMPGILSSFWLVGALVWLGHIVVDWAFGDGLRTPDGFIRGAVRSVATERVR